jgi:type I restriction enzyme R subunit
VFESIIVITDRKVLDKQIRDTIKGFAQVDSVVGHATDSSALKGYIADGKKIIISTVQKFPFIVDEISNHHRGLPFAIIIDEAHSSQGGKTAAALNVSLSEAGEAEEDETTEDRILRFMSAKKMLPNASYFAFTATPKAKTLELFGVPCLEGDKVRYRPFHEYMMKQAIEDNPVFDEKKAKKKLRHYVESHDKATRAMTSLVNSNLEIFKLFSDNEDFKRFVTQTSFKINYQHWGHGPGSHRPTSGA